MIDIDKLKSITHLVTHANCPDGIASALIVKDALPDVKVSFVHYGSKVHRGLEPEPGTLFCDFTPYFEREMHDNELVGGPAESFLKPWLDAGAIVLDHHPTSLDVVDYFSLRGLGFFGENERNECGAWLAYEHVWLPLKKNSSPGPVWEHMRGPVRDFANLAAIRDTWKKDNPRWKAACEQAALVLFWTCEKPLSSYLEDSEGLGKKLVAKQLSAAQRSLDESLRFKTAGGLDVIMFQGVSTTSDAAELYEKSDLVVGFHYRWDVDKLWLQFSTRSHTGFDCASFAKAHGGGGHKAAAGFTVEVSPDWSQNPYQTFRLLLEQWEGRADLLSDEEMFGR